MKSLVFLTNALLVVAACGGGGPTPAATARPLLGTLVVYGQIFTDAAEALKRGFAAVHPDVKVEFVNPAGPM